MNKNYFFASAIAAMAVLASCSKSDDVISTSNDHSLEVSISPQVIEEAASRVNTITPKTAWATNDKIGVFFADPTQAFFNAFTGATQNGAYTYTSGTGWAGQTLNVTTSMPKVYAYYPHSATGNTNPAAIKVVTNADFMIGHSDAPVISNGKADYRITMKHALTQFQFTMKKDASYTAAGTVSSLKIKTSSDNILYTEGTINLNTEVFTGTTSVRELAYTPNVNLGPTTVFRGSGCPVAANNTMTLELTIDGRNYKYAFPSGTTWVAGKNNRYNFTLTATGLTIGAGDNGSGSGITIGPWVDTTDTAITLTPIG